MKLYGEKEAADVVSARRSMYAAGNKNIGAIPPTPDVLLQKIRRSAFVSGHLWASPNVLEGTLESPSSWGFTNQSGWKAVWTTQPTIWEAVRELDSNATDQNEDLDDVLGDD
ncbi:Taxoid 7-beta-hydroxylase [Frankliniella fusca]|uniref:Taxoid 7-beta-hydroxylase n=1 Tax=Frankliniella fusca TaxID=407009 RepID=A0AAE1HI12_9NEOP|nr:Taxoid 7-beta-hydroxylase [Frankliniella fusca]